MLRFFCMIILCRDIHFRNFSLFLLPFFCFCSIFSGIDSFRLPGRILFCRFSLRLPGSDYSTARVAFSRKDRQTGASNSHHSAKQYA
jgi:hypothetical protein